MSESWWRVTFNDGSEETVFGEARDQDGVLTVVERYGVTGGIKNLTHYPLTSVRKWTREDSWR